MASSLSTSPPHLSPSSIPRKDGKDGDCKLLLGLRMVKERSKQHFPVPGEPVCVVCGKYGEYICNELGVFHMDKIEKDEERKKKTLKDALTSDAWVTPSDAWATLSSLRKKY